MKAVYILKEMPTKCMECPFHQFIAFGLTAETACVLVAKRNKDGINTKAEWCPLSHPLKSVSNDFYIYDRKYLFDHLDREIELLQSTKRFEEHMKAREEEWKQ